MQLHRKIIGCAVAQSLAVLALCAGVFASEPSVSQMESKSYELSVRSMGEQVTFPKGISVAGTSMEGKTIEEARAFIDDYVNTRRSRSVTLSVFGDNVYNYDGSSFGVTWSNPQMVDSLSSYVSDGNFIEQYKKQKDLESGPVNLDIELSFDEASLREKIQALADNFSAEPINATAVRIPEGFSVTEGVAGKSFNVDSITADLKARITDFDNTEGIYYDLPFEEIPPAYTSQDFMGFALLGTWATGNLGPNPNRIHNIELSGSRVNGTLIYPGEEYSALGLYGAQTLDNGYLIAPGYLNGTQVDVPGGGVCQTTTTLYNALIRADVTITQRFAHSMLVTYVAPAMDAAVAEGSKDLKFRNDFEHPIYLESYTTDGKLVMNVWGVDPDPDHRTNFRTDVESVIWLDPLYDVVVDNSKVVYGPNCDPDAKETAPVESHPKVVATSYRQIEERQPDGSWVVVSESRLNHDTYQEMRGLLYIASDVKVVNEPRTCAFGEGVYPYLGWTIFHGIYFKNGEPWNPATAKKNYEP